MDRGRCRKDARECTPAPRETASRRGGAPQGRSRPVLSVFLPWRFVYGSGGGADARLCRVRRRSGPGPRIKSVPRSVDARGIGGAAASELKGGGVIAHRPAQRVRPPPVPPTGFGAQPESEGEKMRQSQRAEQLATEVRISTRKARWPSRFVRNQRQSI